METSRYSSTRGKLTDRKKIQIWWKKIMKVRVIVIESMLVYFYTTNVNQYLPTGLTHLYLL